MEFYLHDMSGGRSPTWATVLAAVRVRVRSREDNDARADQAPTSEPSSQHLLAAEGDLESCAMGMAFLDGHGDIEDWGCGAGDARRFVTKSRYIGVDSHGGADRIADLRHYMSITDCVFMRHVLEHRHDWRHVLANAVRSFGARMVLIISTPFGEKTRRIDESPRAGAARVPVLSFWKEEVTELLAGHPYREEVITADTPFGIEHIFYIEARSRARA
jgi:hypothetical protein